MDGCFYYTSYKIQPKEPNIELLKWIGVFITRHKLQNVRIFQYTNQVANNADVFFFFYILHKGFKSTIYKIVLAQAKNIFK